MRDINEADIPFLVKSLKEQYNLDGLFLDRDILQYGYRIGLCIPVSYNDIEAFGYQAFDQNIKQFIVDSPIFKFEIDKRDKIIEGLKKDLEQYQQTQDDFSKSDKLSDL